MQAFSDTASSRRHSLDLHELMKSSIPSWTRQTLDTKEEDREFKSGEWIDKHEELNQDDSLISPDNFYQSMTPLQQSLYATCKFHLTNNSFILLHVYLCTFFLLLISNIFSKWTETVGNKTSKCRVLQITNLMKA